MMQRALMLGNIVLVVIFTENSRLISDKTTFWSLSDPIFNLGLYLLPLGRISANMDNHLKML